jgi:hypothetical protein
MKGVLIFFNFYNNSSIIVTALSWYEGANTELKYPLDFKNVFRWEIGRSEKKKNVTDRTIVTIKRFTAVI